MKPQDTTEMEKILKNDTVNGLQFCGEPVFCSPEAETMYYSLQTELRKLVNTKR